MGSIGDLPLAAADILWEDLDLGAKPFPLEIPSYGGSAEERARVRSVVYTQLQRRGLAAGGRPTSDLTSTLRLLAGPQISIDLVALRDMAAPAPLRAVVAARGQQAVLAVQREQVVTLTEVRGNAIVGSIVDLLPVNRAGPGQPVTVPDAMLTRQAAPGGRHRLLEPGEGAATMHQDTAGHREGLRAIAAVLARPTVRAGAFGVLLGDGRRLPGLSYFDTDRGRYVAASERRGTESWTTLCPADSPRLARQLGRMVLTAFQAHAEPPTGR